MASKWVLNRPDGPWDYVSLGFTASNGDILDAVSAPDAYWTLNIDQAAAETVRRHGTGVDSGYVEPADGRILTWNATTNQYEPRPPSIAFATEIATVQAARDATLAVGTTNDAIIASRISTVGTATAAALSGRNNLVAGMKRFQVIGHRGMAARYPEESMEGWRASAQAGYLVDVDLALLSDNTSLVCLHDATVGRTMTGLSPTATPETLTRAQWSAGRIAPRILGGRASLPTYFEQVLSEFGGRYIISAEIKSGGTAAATAFINAVKARGLEKAVLASSFDGTVCAALRDAGLTTLFLSNSFTGAAAAAAGYQYLGIDASMGWSYVNTQAASIPVLIYTSTTYALMQDAITNAGTGVVGYYSNDPIADLGLQDYLSDPFSERAAWPGAVGIGLTGTSTDTVVAQVDGTVGLKQTVASGTHYVEQGWVGELPSAAFEIDFTLEFGTAGTTTLNHRMLFSGTTHQVGNESTHADYLLVLLRRNGVVDIYRKIAGGAVPKIATATWAGLADGAKGTPKRYAIISNATGVTVTCTTTGETLSVPDATTQMGNVATRWLTSGNSGAEATMSKVVKLV